MHSIHSISQITNSSPAFLWENFPVSQFSLKWLFSFYRDRGLPAERRVQITQSFQSIHSHQLITKNISVKATWQHSSGCFTFIRWSKNSFYATETFCGNYSSLWEDNMCQRQAINTKYFRQKCFQYSNSCSIQILHFTTFILLLFTLFQHFQSQNI